MPTAAIRKIYDSYFEKALAAEQNRKPTDGMFGIGKKPGDDPCHAEFAAELEAALKAYREESPVSPEIRELLEKVDCRYTLAVEASKRAREIIAGSLPLIDTKETKPLSIAIEEINRRLITYTRNEEAETEE